MNIEEMVEVFPEEENDNEQNENDGEEYIDEDSTGSGDPDGADSEDDDYTESNSADEEGEQEETEEEEGNFTDESDSPVAEEQDCSEVSNETESSSADSDENLEESEGSSESTSDDPLRESEDCENEKVCTGKSGSVKRTLVFSFLAIFAALALILGYFVFFNKSVVGTWKIDRNGENKGVAALIFDPDGKATYTTGSYVVTGNWSKDGDNLNLNIGTDEGTIFSGKYTCRVSTGLIDKTVELTSEKKERINLKQYKMEEAVHPVNNFVPKDELLGKWSTGKEGSYTYEFKDNGLVVLNKGNVTITFTYYFDDESITLMKYYLKDSADETPRTRVRYSVNNGILKIGSMTLKKV